MNDEGPYHIKTSQLICKSNQRTGFSIIGTSVMKELNVFQSISRLTNFCTIRYLNIEILQER